MFFKRKTKCLVITAVCLSLFFALFSFWSFADENLIDVVLTVNDPSYGTVSSSSPLTGLNSGDVIKLSAETNSLAYVDFVQWAVYKGSDFLTIATEGVDYSFADNLPQTEMTILGSENLQVCAVFQGKIVNINRPTMHFSPVVLQNTAFRVVDVNGNIHSFTEAVTGWNNNPNEPIAAELTVDNYPEDGSAAKELVLRTYSRVGGAGGARLLLANGASYDFTPGTTSSNGVAGYYDVRLPEDFNWIEYDFRIVDDNNNTLKDIVLTFKYPGLATIVSQNGAIKVGDIFYTDGEKARIGVGEKAIEAVPEEGYKFVGWEISRIELDDSMENPLDFFMPYDDSDVVIKAKFEKIDAASDITVTTGSSKFIENENYSINGNVLTVSYDVPCRVGYIGADGKFVSINAIPIEGRENTYSFTIDDSEVKEVFLVVKGDANGNGGFDGGDITKAKAVSLGNVTLSDARLFAADANGNGSFDGGDITRMKAVSLGKKSFDW